MAAYLHDRELPQRQCDVTATRAAIVSMVAP